MVVRYGERVVLIGLNGCEKSIFLKMVLKEKKLSVLPANLPQSVIFNNDKLIVLESFREDISILEGKARGYLAKFLFYSGNVFKKIKL